LNAFLFSIHVTEIGDQSELRGVGSDMRSLTFLI